MAEQTPERITACIERANCAAVVGGEAGPASIAAALQEVRLLLDDLTSSALDGDAVQAFRTGVEQALAGDPENLPSLLERLQADWTALSTERPVVEEPAPPSMDDELAMLQMDAELAGMFFTEALDHLNSIESLVLKLEASPEDVPLLNDVFRPFHTIKGNAGALGVTSIQEVAHKVENLLDLARSGKHRIGKSGIDIILRAVDVIKGQVTDVRDRIGGARGRDWTADRHALMGAVDSLIQHGEPEETPSAAPLPAADGPATPVDSMPARRAEDTQPVVKVDTRKLDNLVDMVGELVIVQSIINEDPALAAVVDERLTRNLAQLKRITTELQRNAMAMRMVPIRQTFQKMARLVRDLSRKSGKQVEMVLSGEDTELDRKVVEDINDPLMHMVRNSVDHGIESPDARSRAGKRPTGRLSLDAFHQGGNIVISIADDGAGLNTERIYQKAVAQGLVEPGAQLSPADIHHMIFRPGFSTAERVTEISGRGVGMDVVRRNLEALRGRIDIQTRAGEGTTFDIRLPLTLAIIEGLVLGVGAERYVLPTFSICESLRPLAGQVHRIQGHPRIIQVRDRLLPLVTLAGLFTVPGARLEPVDGTVVVIDDGGRRIALLVDRLLGKQEVVIKSLGDAFSGVRGLSGGAILGDGRIGLILDAHGLVELQDGTAAAAA